MIERRIVKLPVSIRADEAEPEAVGNTLYGYAAVFNSVSEDLGGFVEVLDPSCFDRTLAEADVRALYNHDCNHIIGRTKSGTLRLSVDDIGLKFEDDLPTTGIGPFAREQVARGDIDGCSFGFVVVRDELEERPGELPLRTILDLDLIEITPCCCFPAYTQTVVNVRSITERLEVLEEVLLPPTKTPEQIKRESQRRIARAL